MFNAAFWLAAWLAASLPWLNQRAFGVAMQWPTPSHRKPLWLTAFESLLLYGLVYIVMFFVEAQRGQRADQAWQFWVIALCLWVVLAFPAAAWFKLRKQ
jgi:Protein of unknown function (DUF2818)